MDKADISAHRGGFAALVPLFQVLHKHRRKLGPATGGGIASAGVWMGDAEGYELPGCPGGGWQCPGAKQLPAAAKVRGLMERFRRG